MHGKKKKAASTINLLIETLTGTVFEMKVSSFEQVNTLKMKIQQLEGTVSSIYKIIKLFFCFNLINTDLVSFNLGIPISQQHILWKSMELKGELTLKEYNIKDGATLQLVLGMRGGPKSMRSGQGCLVNRKFKLTVFVY